MNRTVITRLVPLTTSVAIHAALVALVLSLVDLTAPVERVFLLELRSPFRCKRSTVALLMLLVPP